MRHFKRRRFGKFHISRREKFLATTIILTAGLVATQLISFDQRLLMVVGLSVITYILSAWVLREDLEGVEWFTLLILPSLYTAAVCLFYFLLPARWITRVPTALFYAIGMYAVLLTENIYNVSAERSIQLVRAAHSIGYLITLMTAFLFFNTLFALHLPFYFNALGAALITFPLSIQSLWSVVLTERSFSPTIWWYAIAATIIIAELALTISLWPIRGVVAALVLSAALYTLIGTGQQRLMDRLFKTIIREFIIVIVIVFMLSLFATRWGGS